MTKRVCLVKDPRCGTRAGAQAHAKHGEYLCPPCLAANRAYHRTHSKIPSRVRQRTLAELRKRHPERFAELLEVHRAEVDKEVAERGEQIGSKTRSNRIRQRALAALGKEYPGQYQRIYTDKLMQIMVEED